MNINDCIDSTPVKLKISELIPDPKQPRKYIDEDKMDELQRSIAAQGILHPILYREEEGKNIIVCGERRYEAAKRLRLLEVSALRVIKDHETIALLDNIQRSSLTAMEESLGVKRLLEETGVEQKQLMEKLGKAESTISEMKKLTELPEDMQEAALTSAFWSRNKLLKLAKIEDKKTQKAEFEKMKAVVDKKEAAKQQKRQERLTGEKVKPENPQPQAASDPAKKIAVFKSHVTKLHDRVKNEMTKGWQTKDKNKFKKELQALVTTINEFLEDKTDEKELSEKKDE